MRVGTSGVMVRLGMLASLIVLQSWPGRAEAFKAKAHVSVANLALGEIDLDQPGGEYVAIRPHGYLDQEPLQLENSAVMKAVKNYPAYFRAGALGPDFFPDMVEGQLWVHPNNGCQVGYGDDRDVEFSFTPPYTVKCTTPSFVPMEERKVNQWRSIDYGMYQLRQALLWRGGNTADPEWQQAVAFAYGYLAHEAGDSFAHAWLNEWTGDTFFLWLGQGVYGTVTEEFKHIALETYLDRHLYAGQTDATIATPESFLNSIYWRKEVGDPGNTVDPATKREVDIVKPDAAGSFGGQYYQVLSWVRDYLLILEDHTRWTQLADYAPAQPGLDAVQASLDLQALLDHIGSGGSDLLTPIGDIEDYFKRRREIVELLLDKWVRLSTCVAQNQAMRGRLPADQPLRQDACAINFEDTADLRDLFRGKLNEAAAWHDPYDANFDYGTLGNNLTKIQTFVQTVTSVALRFNLLEDVRSIRETTEWLYNCDAQLVQWDSCDNACTWARRKAGDFCTSVVEDYVCSDVMCWALGIPFACDEICDLTLKPVTDNVCIDIVTSAAPFCDICSTNTLCNDIEGARDLADALQNAAIALIQPALDEIKQRATDWLMEKYFGPDWQEMLELTEHVRHAYLVAKPAWMVNLAFLSEDLQSSPGYINDILERVLGVSGAFASNAPLVADAVQETMNSTWPAADRAIQMYVRYKTGTTTQQDRREYWLAFLQVLYRVARDPDRTPHLLTDALDDTAYILDRFDVGPEGGPEIYHSRVANFMLFLDSVKALSGLRGPTVEAFRAELGLTTEAYDPELNQEDDGMIEPHDVPVLHNAIEAVKLGFLGEAALTKLWARFPAAQPSSPRSRICEKAPHLFCDAIQSLDDPGNIRYVWWDAGKSEVDSYCYANENGLAAPVLHPGGMPLGAPACSGKWVHVHPPFGFDVQLSAATWQRGQAGAAEVLQLWQDAGWSRSELGTGTSWPDPELGLARWYSNPYRWEKIAGGPYQPSRLQIGPNVGDTVDACRLALTDFPLAATPERAEMYDRIMRRPPSCPQTWEKDCKEPITCNARGMNCGLVQDDHCGGLRSCGTCAAGEHCDDDDNRCVCDNSNKVDCGQGCTDLATDANNCGRCFNFCDGPRPTFSVPTCDAGTCGFKCWDGYPRIGDRCVDPYNDPTHCGTTGTTCPGIAGGHAVCTGGKCGLACDGGLTLATVNGTRQCLVLNDPAKCGLPGAQVKCDAPVNGHGQAACTAGVCDVACAAGYDGRSVQRSETVSGGYGAPSTTRTWIERSCIPVLSDPSNCGATGHACTAPTNATPTCAAGLCGFTCNTGSALVYGITCRDISSDWKNCGGVTTTAKSYTCPQPDNGYPKCKNGECELHCNHGYGLTDGRCADLARDVNNCGAVGTKCPTMANADASCSNGVCGLACKPGATGAYTAVEGGYGGSTINVLSGCYYAATDVNHCGSSLVRCPETTTGHSQRSCSNGQCSLVCDANYGLKATTTTTIVTGYGGVTTTTYTTTYECRDLTSDPDNCGAIGTSCPSSNVATRACVSRQCQFTCKTGYQKCGNACLSRTDVNNCGSCGNSCPTPAHATRVCSGSTPACSFTCSYGYYRSGSACVACPVGYGGVIDCP